MQFDQLKRREFMTLLGGAAARPLAARAQQAGRMRRIGLLLAGAENDPGIVVFRRALPALGWEEGRNLEIVYRWGAGDIERMRTSVAELVELAPDIIVCSGTPVLGLLHQATRSIPIVFAGINDSVGLGYVASMAGPGGNITGLSLMDVSLIGKWLDLLKQIAPVVNRTALIFNPDTTAYYFNFLRSFESVPRSVAAELKGTPVRDMAEVERLCAEFAREPGGSLLIPADPFRFDGTIGIRLDGAAKGDQAGNSVAEADDVNGDGFADPEQLGMQHATESQPCGGTPSSFLHQSTVTTTQPKL